jgi:DnaJ family protein C protein 17
MSNNHPPHTAASDLDVDWYAVLDLDLTATEAQIRKAVRQLALKYHPDKAGDDPVARVKFEQITKARDLLTDEHKKAEIDQALKARRKRKEHEDARSKGMDSKRKQMKEDLERKLAKARGTGAAAGPVAEPRSDAEKRTDSSTSKNKQTLPKYDPKILEQFRSDTKAKMESFLNEQEADEARRTREFYQHRQNIALATASDTETVSGSTQIKFKWRKSGVSQSEDSLYQLLKVYGSIEDITLSDTHGTSAVVTYSDVESAQRAVRAFDISIDFRVSLIEAKRLKSVKADVFTHVYGNSTPLSDGNTTASTYGNEESEMAREVRRAVERERLIQRMQVEEAAGHQDDSATKAMPDRDSHANVENDQEESGQRTDIPEEASETAKSSLTQVKTLEELEAKEAMVFNRVKEFISKRKVSQSTVSS